MGRDHNFFFRTKKAKMPNLLSAQDKVQKSLKLIQKEVKKLVRFQSLRHRQLDFSNVDLVEISRQSLSNLIQKSELKDLDLKLGKSRELNDVEKKIVSLPKLTSFVKERIQEIEQVYKRKRKVVKVEKPKRVLELAEETEKATKLKNRPGQRQRQKINEEIYKENAKHLLKQRMEKVQAVEQEKLHPSWEAKRMQKIVSDVKPTKIKFD